jgi:hypothetical protein
LPDELPTKEIDIQSLEILDTEIINNLEFMEIIKQRLEKL